MALAKALSVMMLGAVDGMRKKQRRAQCGVAGQGTPSTSIVNGDDAPECAWTWQVGLSSYSTGMPWCGGMLISPEWVLTAAHCIAGERNNSIWVVSGEWDTRSRSGNEQNIRSAEVIMHPQYNDRNMMYDIGLIRLSNPVEMNKCVGTVCLPEAGDVAPGTSCMITGWGTLTSGGRQPAILQEGQVSVMSLEECRNTRYHASWITDDMLCAQGKTSSGGIIDACQGDSGGPLVCKAPQTDSWTIYGATSWGQGCAGASYPGIWSRVHYTLDWIQEKMA